MHALVQFTEDVGSNSNPSKTVRDSDFFLLVWGQVLCVVDHLFQAEQVVVVAAMATISHSDFKVAPNHKVHHDAKLALISLCWFFCVGSPGHASARFSS